MLQITHIGYRWAVAIRSSISRVNADMPDTDIIIGLTLTKAILILRM